MASGSLKRDAGLAGALLSDGCAPAGSVDGDPHAKEMVAAKATATVSSSAVRMCATFRVMVCTLSPLRQVIDYISSRDSVRFVPSDILPHDAPSSVNDEYCRRCQTIVEAVVDIVCPRHRAVVIGVQYRERDAIAGSGY